MLNEKSAAKCLTALAEYREKVKSGEIIPTKSLNPEEKAKAKWKKKRFEYLLRASKTEQTFLASHKSLDLVVKEIDDMLDNV